MKKTTPQRTYDAIEYEFDGQVHRGTFYVENGWLTLTTDVGEKSASLNKSDRRALAKILFMELIAEAGRGRP